MANTLTAVTADAFKAAEKVGREPVGLLNSVLYNTGSEAVAQGESVKSLTTEEPTINTSATPAMTIPEGDDQTFGEDSFDLDQVVNAKLNVTGEEQVKLDQNHDYETAQGNRLERVFRRMRNAIEASACGVVYKGASRAFGTAGTTPFGSNFNECAEIRQIIVDNGFWEDGQMSLVVNTNAGTNLRQLATLTGVNTAGTDATLRDGELLNLQGLSLKESAGIALHTIGTGSSYLVDFADGYGPLSTNATTGDTTIHVDTGTGTFVPGDVVTVADDSGASKLVVGTGFAGDGDGDVIMNEPGLIAGEWDDDKAVSIGAAFTANVAVNRTCVEVAARPQKAPKEGDAAQDVIQVPDPVTGLVYEIREYPGYKKVMWDITLVYNTKVWHPEGVAILLG